MKKDLLEKARCPICLKHNFKIITQESDSREIRNGKVMCLNCNNEFNIEDGIVNMLGRIDKFVLGEQKGWERFAQEEGWFTPPEEYIIQLPRPNPPIPTDTLNWETHADNFDIIINKLSFQGKYVLDIGAGRCWTTKHITLNGAKCVAMDILTHPGVGLKAADILMKHEGIYFDRVLGDMNNIPFEDETFDVAFFSGALHHTINLDKTLKEVFRVLKRKGQIAMTNEACGGISSFESVKLEEKQKGINEHNYRYSKYLKVLKNSGFKNIRVFPDIAFKNVKRSLGKHKIINPFFTIFPNSHYPFYIKMYLFGGPLLLIGNKE